MPHALQEFRMQTKCKSQKEKLGAYFSLNELKVHAKIQAVWSRKLNRLKFNIRQLCSPPVHFKLSNLIIL